MKQLIIKSHNKATKIRDDEQTTNHKITISRNQTESSNNDTIQYIEEDGDIKTTKPQIPESNNKSPKRRKEYRERERIKEYRDFQNLTSKETMRHEETSNRERERHKDVGFVETRHEAQERCGAKWGMEQS